MTTAMRRPLLCAVAVLTAFASVTAAGPAGVAAASVDEPATTEPTPTEPPASEPPSTEPTNTEAPSSEPSVEPSDADDVETTATVIGVLAFMALIGVAAWWMVRRRDSDDEPHPPTPRADDPLPGSDLI